MLLCFHSKSLCRFILFLYTFFIQKDLAAQDNESLYGDSIFKKYASTAIQEYNTAKPYYISIVKNITPPVLKSIRRLNDQTAIIEVNSQAMFDSLSSRIKMAAAKDIWKLSPSLEKFLNHDEAIVRRYIVNGQNADALLEVLKYYPKQIQILSVNKPSHSVIIKCNAKFLKHYLLGLKEIIFVDAAAEAYSEASIIGYNRSFHGINTVDYTIEGANGRNIVVGVKEQKMDETDIDLWKRVLPSSIAATTTSNHATVIASIIGGAGNSFYDGRGIAWGCTFFPSSFTNLFADDATILETNQVSVQNHSYGTTIQQFYGAEAVSYDMLTWNNTTFIPVVSAGNQGEAFATEGRYANLPGYANLTGNFKMAKNSIIVGAIDNVGNIPAQSSVGPTYDGRIAPHLTALGPNGTSDAAAVVSGTIAVMQQVYADSNNHVLPPASLIKATLFNTTDDIYKGGIDYKTGYGLLNSYAAIKAVQQNEYDGATISQGQQWTRNISVPANTAQIKVTLVWTDSAAAVNNNKALINDLDLELNDLSGGLVYKPWVLNTMPNADSLAMLAIRKRDSLNTAEQVSVQSPMAGTYQIKVTGTSVNTSVVPFHIAYHIDTLNSFTFTSPQHASDVNKAENEHVTIRWKTFVVDSNETGNLYISYDRGTVWQLLKSSVKLSSNLYNWQVKDTNSIAVLKMETTFGTFFSKDFIISTQIRLFVDFNCADSIRLSWNKHIYASAYQIFTLTDSPYLKPIRIVTDTFAVLQRSVYPSFVFAVEPILSNGFTTGRSGALNIHLQGVQCFYKTLNYDLLDYNRINLILELNAAEYIDSVYFEKVSAAGQLLQIYGSIKVSNGSSIYSQLVKEIPAGTSYLRGRIKLKGGAIVYTDIIPVLTSGKKFILFYPNPINKDNPLQYVLQQGIRPGSQLQLFDTHGRLLRKFTSMPMKIDVSGLPSGVIIFKLVDIENKMIETGKFVIQ